jgi:hypothetical protein
MPKSRAGTKKYPAGIPLCPESRAELRKGIIYESEKL